MQITFPGITHEALEFLMLVRLNDSKEWYEEHKARYRHILLEPFRAAVEDLAPTAAKIDPAIITNPTKCVSRIRRDTRFTNDKSLYRDAIWLSLRRPADNWLERPSFFFEVTPAFYRYGMGFYAASPKAMATFREMMLENTARFRKVTSFLQGPYGLAVDGEAFKRPKDPTLPEELGRFYNRKSFFITSEHSDMERVARPDLIEEVAEAFWAMRELYHFVLEVIGRAYHMQ